MSQSQSLALSLGSQSRLLGSQSLGSRGSQSSVSVTGGPHSVTGVGVSVTVSGSVGSLGDSIVVSVTGGSQSVSVTGGPHSVTTSGVSVTTSGGLRFHQVAISIICDSLSQSQSVGDPIASRLLGSQSLFWGTPCLSHDFWGSQSVGDPSLSHWGLSHDFWGLSQSQALVSVTGGPHSVTTSGVSVTTLGSQALAQSQSLGDPIASRLLGSQSS